MCPKFILMVKRSLLLIQTSTWETSYQQILLAETLQKTFVIYKRSNWIIGDFRVCDSSTLDSLHRTYCMHMYGCELWDLSCKYVSEFKVAWRKIKRCLWGLPYNAHNAIIHSLRYNIDLQLDTRVLKLVHSCLNHCNSVCKSLLSAKLHCIKSTFAANYK